MDTTYWLGSQATYDLNLSIEDRVSALLASGQWQSPDQEESDDPQRFTLIGNVGVIDVTGPLVSSESWVNALLGRTSYMFIRNALIEATTHRDVKAIVLNIDSGGGTPNGLPDCSELVRKVSKSGTPVYAYSGGDMCSAAMWLGASADKAYASEVATVGSVGVIAIHTEVVDALKAEGIKKTVFRAGEYKGIGNPFEHLDKEKSAVIQAGLTTLYDIFIRNIAVFRGKPEQYVRDYMAEGREFRGQAGLEVGLIDGVMTFDDMMDRVQAKIDKRIATPGKENTMAKATKMTTLSQAQRDLVEAGVDLNVALQADLSSVEEAPADPVTDAAPELNAEVAQPDMKPNETVEVGLVSFLREELSAKGTEVTQLNLKVAELERELNAFKVTHEPLKAIAALSLSKMQVAMGAPAMDMSGLTAEVLLMQHAKTREVFCKTFPVGGVAAVGTDETKPTVSEPPINSARLRSNRI